MKTHSLPILSAKMPETSKPSTLAVIRQTLPGIVLSPGPFRLIQTDGDSNSDYQNAQYGDVDCVACPVPLYSVLTNQKGLQNWLAKLSTLKTLQHRNIAKLIGLILPDTDSSDCTIWVLVERKELDLREWLQEEYWKYTVHQHVVLLRDLLSGLCYLHKMKLPLLDLAPENIFVDTKGNLQIAYVAIATSRLRFSRKQSSSSTSCLMKTSSGSSFYRSPEQIVRKKATCAADVFSFALIAIEMLRGKHPLDEFGTDAVKFVLRGDKIESNLCDVKLRPQDETLFDMGVELKRLSQMLQNCLSGTVICRPSAEALYELFDLLSEFERADPAEQWRMKYLYAQRLLSRQSQLDPVEVQSMKQQLATYVEREAELKLEVSVQRAEVIKWREKEHDARSKMQSWHAISQTYQEKTVDLRKRLEVAKARIAKDETQMAEYKNDIAENKQKWAELEAAVEAEFKKLKSKLKEETARADKFEQKLKKRQSLDDSFRALLAEQDTDNDETF